MLHKNLAPRPTGPEAAYRARTDRAHRKAWGQFFTPRPVADLMADWLAEMAPTEVCDPAAGTGVLTRAVRARLPKARVLAIEKDPEIAAAFAASDDPMVQLRRTDFLGADTEGCPAFIANPPYVRHRHLHDYDNARSQLSRRAGFQIAKFSNLYIYFCAKMLEDLRPGGRASVLLPGEWMNANFAHGFKTYLHGSGALRQIIAYSNGTEVFDDALTTASVLLLEKPA